MKIFSKFSAAMPTQWIQNIKTSFFNGKVRLKSLVKDTFSRTTTNNKNVRHSGDNFEHTPEFVLKDGDTAGISVRKAKFYPEDTAKMSQMSVDERIKYKSDLMEKGKHSYE